MAYPNTSRSHINGNGATTSDNKHYANTLSTNYGNAASVWGSNSIWSNGNGSLSNGLTSRVATRENSCDGLKQLGEKDMSLGGLKTNASLSSNDAKSRALWDSKWAPSSGRSLSHINFPEGQSSQQQRSISNAASGSYSAISQGLGSATLLEPKISPTTAKAPTPPTFRTNFSNPTTFGARSNDQPPTVYTKFDRPQDPNAKRIPDSAKDNLWGSNISPTDTRGSRPFVQTDTTSSQATSRNNSQPAVQMMPTGRSAYTAADYARGSQASKQHDSRAPSASSRRNPSYNAYSNQSGDQIATSFGQLNMNGEGRPQNYHRGAESAYHSQPFSAGVSPYARSSFSTASVGLGAQDEMDELENDQYLGFPTALSPISTGYQGYAPPTQSWRYPPTPSSAEFQPGQPYGNNQIVPRGYDVSTGAKAAHDWQIWPNGAVTPSRQYMSAAEQQMMFHPQFQQMLAAQFRHYGPMYSPYHALQHSLQMQYLQGMPMSLPSVDPSTPPHELNVGEGVQSALMYEFKTNTKSKRYELRDIYDHIAEFSGDQHGSRFIQTKLETANSDEKDRVFREIEPNAYQLMTDVFGNYVIQKFFEHGDQKHKKILAHIMRGHVFTLSMQMYGCRVVQKALDHVLVDQQAQLISELDQQVLACVKDQNGNHVIQKAIERCPPSSITFIIASFQNEVQHLSVNSYGCRVIQRCLERCDPPAKAMIMSELMDGIQGMITDQYGNYVVQHVVQHDEGEGRRRVLNIVAKNLELYSKHKFASNVVEKCLERADDNWRREMVYALANHERRGMDGDGVLVSMIKDNFGNYVIQKLLDTLNQQDYFLFLDILQPAVSHAKRTGCGKQLQSVERKMDRFSRNRYVPYAPTGPSAGNGGFNGPQQRQYQQGLFGAPAAQLGAHGAFASAANRGLNGDAVEGAQVGGRQGR